MAEALRRMSNDYWNIIAEKGAPKEELSDHDHTERLRTCIHNRIREGVCR